MSLFRPRKPAKPGAQASIWEMLFNGNGLFGSDSNGKWEYKSGVYFYKPNFPSSSGGKGGAVAENYFPFKLYQIPANQNSTGWLKWCVRAGAVFINWVKYDATLTDGGGSPFDTNKNPDENDPAKLPMAGSAGENEVTLTAGQVNWFWLAIDGTGAEVDHGYTSLPTWGTGYVPIASVDCTDTTGHTTIVRQYVRTDLFTCI